MVTVYDVPANELIEALKEELKKNKNIKPPEWAFYAKSGVHKERPPQQEDFWYIRGAALLRKVYMKGPIGVSRLRTLYGGRKHRGSKPEKFKKASGNIIRKLLQQLETAGYIKKEKTFGRVITSFGQSFLNNVAKKVAEELKIKTEKVNEIKRKSKNG